MNSSDDLSRLLQSWQPKAAEKLDFNRGVWARLEAVESRQGVGFAALFSWAALFTRPRVALAAVTLALVGGGFLGTVQARSAGEEQYLRSLNPYSVAVSHSDHS